MDAAFAFFRGRGLLGMAFLPAVVGIFGCANGPRLGGGAIAPGAPTATGAPPAAGTATGAATATGAPPAAGTATDSASVLEAPQARSAFATLKTDPAWGDCHATLKAQGAPEKGVAALASACAEATQMKRLGRTVTGRQSDSHAPQSFPLQARAKHCYRVYAQADADITQFQAAIEDSAGTLTAQEVSVWGEAVVPRDGGVCFKDNDAASVVISVGRGAGAYAFQVWED